MYRNLSILLVYSGIQSIDLYSSIFHPSSSIHMIHPPLTHNQTHQDQKLLNGGQSTRHLIRLLRQLQHAAGGREAPGVTLCPRLLHPLLTRSQE